MSLIEQSKVKINIVDLGDERKLSFQGVIDEEFSFNQLKGNASKYLVDFKGLKGINSCGIREWIHFVEGLGGNVKIEYYNCPQVVVQQMNMVSGFLTSNAEVKTFYAPYFCEESDEEKLILLKAEQIIDGKAPELSHEVDGEKVELEFDAIEEQYFKFLSK